MGAVYQALDQRLGITVALKETLSSEASNRRQFEREARLLAGMHHPALPRVSDHFVEGNRAFLVMEFISGVDLARIISQQPGPFPREQVVAWADQLLDALVYLHSRDRQVIHRDIKPNNLKLTGTGQIVLLDFGLARAQASDPSITSSQAFFGYTRHYAPIEQIQDQHTDPRSDIYALGATLYHLLTGIKPPDAMVRAAAVVYSGPDPLQPANKIHQPVGPELAAILAKAMAQKPEDRYADANEFRQALARMGQEKSRTVSVKEEAGNVEHKAVSRRVPAVSRNVRSNELTIMRVHESPVVNLALVASGKQFGPAGATAVLALVLTFASGLVYGAYKWFPTPEKVDAVLPANSASALRQAVSSRKSERSRTTAGLELVIPTKTKSTTTIIDQQTAEKRSTADAKKSQSQRSTVFVSKPEAVISGRGVDSPGTASRKKTASRPGAPSIRLPNPEFQDNVPPPSPDNRVRIFRSSSANPKKFRGPNNDEMAKFLEGYIHLADLLR
jgi:serine/threonine protein kinase